MRSQDGPDFRIGVFVAAFHTTNSHGADTNSDPGTAIADHREVHNTPTEYKRSCCAIAGREGLPFARSLAMLDRDIQISATPNLAKSSCAPSAIWKQHELWPRDQANGGSGSSLCGEITVRGGHGVARAGGKDRYLLQLNSLSP